MIIGTQLPSSMTINRLSRYSGSANPIGNPSSPTRETLPLAANASPRVMHPKLNGKPWSTSYAVKRTEGKPKRGTKRRGYGAS